jgi:hypothetical protein
MVHFVIYTAVKNGLVQPIDVLRKVSVLSFHLGAACNFIVRHVIKFLSPLYEYFKFVLSICGSRSLDYWLVRLDSSGMLVERYGLVRGNKFRII